jgi:hypothetical protein
VGEFAADEVFVGRSAGVGHGCAHIRSVDFGMALRAGFIADVAGGIRWGLRDIPRRRLLWASVQSRAHQKKKGGMEERIALAAKSRSPVHDYARAVAARSLQ